MQYWHWLTPAFRGLIVSMGAIALAGCGEVPDTIRIGVAQPLSGPSAARGQDLLNGAQLAVNDLNASGFRIGGKPVKFEIVAKDDKADPATAKTVAQQLVDEKVVAVIGHLSSDVTETTAPIYAKGNVPQLFTSSATKNVQIAQGNGFRLIANDTLQAQAMVGYVTESLRAENVAIIYEDTAYGKPIREDAVAALTAHKKKVDIQIAVDNKTTAFADHVAKLKDQKVDAVITVLRDNQLIPFLDQMSAAGLSDVPVLGAGGAKTSKLANAAQETQRLFVTSGAIEAKEFPAGQNFLANFRKTYNSDPVWAAHYAYDAVYVLASTIQRAESVKGDKLKEKLRTIDPQAPVTGSMRFADTGEQRYGAISVYRRKAGGWDPLMRSDKW
jgi:branched-chain amino acid transport system substrate-binding protein